MELCHCVVTRVLAAMTELERLRKVYAHLRVYLGADVPAGEILKLSIAFIDFVRETNQDFNVDQESHSRVFTNWAVDVAMSDNAGWRVLRHELRNCSAMWADDELEEATEFPLEARKFQMSIVPLYGRRAVADESESE